MSAGPEMPAGAAPSAAELDALEAQLQAAEDAVEALEARYAAEAVPALRRLEAVRHRERVARDEAAALAAKAAQTAAELSRVAARVAALEELAAQAARLRTLVAAQRRAIVAAWVKLEYNRKARAHAEHKIAQTDGRVEQLLQIIEFVGQDLEGLVANQRAARAAHAAQLAALGKANEQAAEDLEAHFAELEEAERIAELEKVAAQKRLEEILRETEEVRGMEEEFRKLKAEQEERYVKLADALIRGHVNDIMFECEEAVKDFDRIKSDDWAPPVFVNRTQFISVEWTDFDSPMRRISKESSNVPLYLLPKPFNKGTFRVAHYAKDNEREYVAKKFHASWRKELLDLLPGDRTDEAGRRKDKESVEKVIQMNRLCQRALEAFDAALRKAGHEYELSFVDIWLAEENASGTIWFLEEPLPSFERFTNNGDYGGDENTVAGRLMGCFEHHSFEHYGRKFIVTDLQGHHDGAKVFRLSDPALHILAENRMLADLRHFMDGNRGLDGLVDFLGKHRCNEFCADLGLPALPAVDELVGRYSGRK